MICYRDRTFCIAQCTTPDCPDRLTEQVERDAQRWWGHENAPISAVDLSSRCSVYTEPKLLERNPDHFKFLYPE